MAHYRNTAEIPFILVGTQDDTRVHRLCNDLKRCTYYETCATYGLNVERVFQDDLRRPTTAVPPAAVPTTTRRLLQ
ncbi:unnamed protein product [Callosobruchus maculatus]|uniref:Uncharacterized protein n=1 Tax=Callosobruchus maculatus TaxID=64391 RepID=A0A653CUV9_CALMS|nr:unnamed protein product [Callosobruchus maculatus]